jgi:hypothetical protein
MLRYSHTSSFLVTHSDHYAQVFSSRIVYRHRHPSR